MFSVVCSTTSMKVLWIRNWRKPLHMCQADTSCALTRWQHFCAWNDVMADILNIWCRAKNRILSIDEYLLKNYPANFTPIWFEMTEPYAFLKRSLQPNKKNNKNKMSINMRSFPNPKTYTAEVTQWQFNTLVMVQNTYTILCTQYQ